MPSRLIVGCAALGGVAGGVIALRIARSHPTYTFAGEPWTASAALLLAGFALLAAAIVVMVLRPGRPGIGAGMSIAAGSAWFGAEWGNPAVSSAAVFSTGLVVAHLVAPLAAMTALAVSRGRVRPHEWVAAILAVIAGAAAGIVPNLWFDPDRECAACAANLLLVGDDPDRARRLGGLSLGAGAAVFGILTVVLGVRIVRNVLARRWDATALAAVPAALLTAAAGTMASGIESGYVPTGARQRGLWFAEACSVFLVAAAVVGTALRRRQARVLVTQLVVGLGDGAGRLDLALAHALGDPTLRLAYPVDGGRYVDADGADVETNGRSDAASVVLTAGGRPAAVLLHQRHRRVRHEVIEELIGIARLALEHERLHAQVRVHERALHASRAKVVAAADEERRRLERDLHDGVQQRLIGLLIAARLTTAMVDRAAARSAHDALAAATAAVEKAIGELRVIARGLYPAVLDDQGLAAAIDALFEDDRKKTAVDLELPPFERFDPAVEHTAYRIVAAADAVGARRVGAGVREKRIHVEVEAAALPDSIDELIDRVGAVNGTMQVVPTAGGSVLLRAELPCAS